MGGAHMGEINSYKILVEKSEETTRKTLAETGE
jgi:hypothetical protein